MTVATASAPSRSAISAERLMAHCAEFAKRAKLSGSPEERESFAYLEARMREVGYATTLLLHEAFISLPVSSRLVVDGTEIPSITHSMSRATWPAGIEAELVSIGAGELADFEGRDVSGRIVLVEGVATPEIAVLASRAGALAHVHVSPTEHLYEMCVSPVWGSPSHLTRADLPTAAAATISRDDGARLRARLEAGERLRIALTTAVDTGWRETPLLVAELPPADGEVDAPFVLFSGHHDTWHLGVMDNGSANAAMLEAARLLAKDRAAWRRGLRVCFWSGHSHGRYSGSAWYADEHWDELERRCAAHVNVDSLGAVGASVLTDSGVADELKAVAAEAVFAVMGQVHKGRRQGRAADQSFWGVGVPSLFGSLSHQPPGPVSMPVALGWWWHTPHDSLDRIDPDNLVRDTDIVLRVLSRLLAAPVIPLDYGRYADALGAELDRLSAGLAGRLDIAPLLSGTAALRRNARAVTEAAATASGGTARRLDRALMSASRALVPISYTVGDRFRHDPALAQPPWPSLDPLRALAAFDPADPDGPFHLTDARQARNRVSFALREANQHLTETFVPAPINRGGVP